MSGTAAKCQGLDSDRASGVNHSRRYLKGPLKRHQRRHLPPRCRMDIHSGFLLSTDQQTSLSHVLAHVMQVGPAMRLA